jgi:hypothetical protein
MNDEENLLSPATEEHNEAPTFIEAPPAPGQTQQGGPTAPSFNANGEQNITSPVWNEDGTVTLPKTIYINDLGPDYNGFIVTPEIRCDAFAFENGYFKVDNSFVTIFGALGFFAMIGLYHVVRFLYRETKEIVKERISDVKFVIALIKKKRNS